MSAKKAAVPKKAPAVASPATGFSAFLQSPLLVFLATAALALVVRLIYLVEIQGAPMTSMLLGDSMIYDAWAREIASGKWLGDEIFFQAPFYPYFLGLIYSLFGHSLGVVRLVQILAGTAACGFLALAARPFLGKRAGLAAGLLLALYPTAIFFDCLIQKTVFAGFFLALLLYLVSLGEKKPRPLLWLGTGVAMGLLAMVRENALIVAPLVLAWLALRFRDVPARARGIWCALFLAGLLAVFLPVALRNLAVGGEFVLSTSQLGANFYAGNNPYAEGRYVPLRTAVDPASRGGGDPARERFDAIDLAQQAMGRKLTPSEVSDYWMGKTIDYVTDNPGSWIGLMARKWFLLANSAEMADMEDIYSYEDYSVLLKGLGFLLHFGTLLPLAALGVCLTAGNWRKLWLLQAMILVYAASVTLFFVVSRYRHPLVPLLCLFAGAAIPAALDHFRRKRTRPLIIGGAVALAFAVIANLPSYPREEFTSITASNVAGTLAARGEADRAVEILRRAVARSPQVPELKFNLALILSRRGDNQEAADLLREVVAKRPRNEQARFMLGQALLALGENDQAAAEYEKALELAPSFAPAELGLGRVALAKGNYSGAIARIKAALERDDRLPGARASLARAYLGAGELGRAAGEYEAVIGDNPNDAAALNALAWIRATSADTALRDPARALELARQADEVLGGRSPGVKDTLAAALAASGRYAEAEKTAREAAEMARQAGRPGLAHEIEGRAEVYARDEDFTEE